MRKARNLYPVVKSEKSAATVALSKHNAGTTKRVKGLLTALMMSAHRPLSFWPVALESLCCFSASCPVCSSATLPFPSYYIIHSLSTFGAAGERAEGNEQAEEQAAGQTRRGEKRVHGTIGSFSLGNYLLIRH